MSSGRSWCSMWPAGRDDVALDVGDDVQPLVELGLGVAVAPPDADVGAVALDPQHRRGDPLPALEPLVDAGRCSGLQPLVVRRRRGARARSPVPGRPPTSAPASQAARSARSSGLVFVQPRGDRVERRRRGAAASASSARRATARSGSGACAGFERGMPKPSRLTRRRTRVGPHARRRASRRCRPCCGRAGRSARGRGRTARRARARGRRGSRGRSRCRPAGVSLAPKPRQSSASTWRSSASASTTNWNDAATSIQPCSITSGGRSSRGERGSPQSSRWWRRPRAATKRLRAGRRGR